MQITPKQFRILIMVCWFVILASVALSIATQPLLPDTLQKYHEAQLNNPLSTTDIYVLVLGVLGTLLYLTIYIGLCFFKAWARKLLPYMFAIGVLGSAIIGPTVEHGWVSALSYLSSILEGAILALAFYSPLSKNFEK